MRKNFISHLKKLHFASIGIVVAFLSIASILLIGSTHVFASSANNDLTKTTNTTTSQSQKAAIGTAKFTLSTQTNQTNQTNQTQTLRVKISLQGTANAALPAYIQGTCSNSDQSGFRLNDIQTDANRKLTSKTDIQNPNFNPSSASYIVVYNVNGNQTMNIACGKISNPKRAKSFTINLYPPNGNCASNGNCTNNGMCTDSNGNTINCANNGMCTDSNGNTINCTNNGMCTDSNGNTINCTNNGMCTNFCTDNGTNNGSSSYNNNGSSSCNSNVSYNGSGTNNINGSCNGNSSYNNNGFNSSYNNNGTCPNSGNSQRILS